jgi:hypothetical protein
MLKSLRLFLAPFQLAAAWQGRFEKFCERVRDRVPESEQCDAPAEIARPVMEAFASTSDDSPLMDMFEELMTKAIDKREAKKLSPEFPALIKSLSPLEALLISDLHKREQYTVDVLDIKNHWLIQPVEASFNFNDYGGRSHHLTLAQALKDKNLVTFLDDSQITKELYPNVAIPEGTRLNRTTIRLSMFGKWFAIACAIRSEIPRAATV